MACTVSRANVSDDPPGTQKYVTPECWDEACRGNFEPFDEWLVAVGFHPSQVAGLPEKLSHQENLLDIQEELLEPLREVQEARKAGHF